MKIIVGISDMKVSNKPDDVLITYSLGSCIGVVIWDPVAKVGGLLHYMLPDSSLDKEKAEAKPFMFADTGIPRLFKETYKFGAIKNRLIVKVVGGSQIMDNAGIFNIGKRNQAVLRKMFWKNQIMLAKEDVGGTGNRTVSLEIGTGITHLKVSGRGEFEL
ncbi:MAG TPA: chemotaxis protein CheD [Desulfurivibrionaceae bacterium]|jgi:chemotaxis protein CheD